MYGNWIIFINSTAQHLWGSGSHSPLPMGLYRSKDIRPARYYLIFGKNNYVLEATARTDIEAVTKFYKALSYIGSTSNSVSDIANQAKDILKEEFNLSLPPLLFVETWYYLNMLRVDGVDIDYRLLAEGGFGRITQYVKEGIPFVVATATKKDDIPGLIEGENEYFKEKTGGALDVLHLYEIGGEEMVLEKAKSVLSDSTDMKNLELLLKLVPVLGLFKKLDNYNRGLLTKAILAQKDETDETDNTNGEKKENKNPYFDKYSHLAPVVKQLNDIRKLRFIRTMQKKWGLGGMASEGKWSETFQNPSDATPNPNPKVEVLVSEDSYIFAIPKGHRLYPVFKKIQYNEKLERLENVSPSYIEFITFFGGGWLKQWGVLVYFGHPTSYPYIVYLIPSFKPTVPAAIFTDWTVASIEKIEVEKTDEKGEKKKEVIIKNPLEKVPHTRVGYKAVHYDERKELTETRLQAIQYFSDLLRAKVDIMPFIENIEKYQELLYKDKKFIKSAITEKADTSYDLFKFPVVLDLDENGRPIIVVRYYKDIDEKLLTKIGFKKHLNDMVAYLSDLQTFYVDSSSVIKLKPLYLNASVLRDVYRGALLVAKLIQLPIRQKIQILQSLEGNKSFTGNLQDIEKI